MIFLLTPIFHGDGESCPDSYRVQLQCVSMHDKLSVSAALAHPRYSTAGWWAAVPSQCPAAPVSSRRIVAGIAGIVASAALAPFLIFILSLLNVSLHSTSWSQKELSILTFSKLYDLPLLLPCVSHVTVKQIDCWHVTFALKFLLFYMCYQKSKQISEYINITFEYLVV